MLKLLHTLAAVFGAFETLILLSSLTVAAILLFTKRLRKRAAWAHALGRLISFVPLALASFVVIYYWSIYSKTIEMLQSTGSLSEAQESVFWRENYIGSGKVFAIGLVATSVLVLLQRNRLPNRQTSIGTLKHKVLS